MVGRERRPPKHLEDEGYDTGEQLARGGNKKKRKVQLDLSDDDQEGSPVRKRPAPRSRDEDDDEDDDDDEEEEEEDDEEDDEEEEDDDGEEEEGEHSGVRGKSSADRPLSLDEMMAEARAKGQRREDASVLAGGSGDSGTSKKKGNKKKVSKGKASGRGAAGAVTSSSQILQMQEKIRLQKELLAMQSSQYAPSTALVPFGIPQSVAPAQSLAAFQLPSGGAAALLPAIQAMVAQAMQRALSSGHASAAASSGTRPPTTGNSGAPNKYSTPKTIKTIGKAVHAVFESGSPEGGFYTTIDPIAKVTRVLLKVPKDDYDWSLAWVANHGDLWQAASTKQMQQRSEVVKKVKHHLYDVYQIRKAKVDYNGFLADIAPLQGNGFRVRHGDPFGDIRVKKVIGHVFLRNWNERVDELQVFIQQAAIVVAVIDIVLGNPAENRAPSDRLPNDGGMALHYEACLKKLQSEVDEFAAGTEYPFIRAPEPSLFMNGEDEADGMTPPRATPNNFSASGSSVRTPLAPQDVNVPAPSSGTPNSGCQPPAID
ncbi:hypothetical protein KFL_011790010, partial [Klebsormidium nitens]